MTSYHPNPGISPLAPCFFGFFFRINSADHFQVYLGLVPISDMLPPYEPAHSLRYSGGYNKVEVNRGDHGPWYFHCIVPLLSGFPSQSLSCKLTSSVPYSSAQVSHYSSFHSYNESQSESLLFFISLEAALLVTPMLVLCHFWLIV